MNSLKKDDGGYIVVETVVSFILYLFVVVSILSLVKIVTVQARIHNAMTQAVTSLSMYSYFFDVVGATSSIQGFDTGHEKVKADVNDFTGQVNELISSITTLDVSGTAGSANYFFDIGQGVSQDPDAAVDYILAAVINSGADIAIDTIFSLGVKKSMEQYLKIDNYSGDEYLKMSNVVDGIDGITFSKSSFLNEKGEIKAVIEYDIEYKFAGLEMPFTDGKIHVTQRAVTKAWLSGNGEGYTD